MKLQDRLRLTITATVFTTSLILSGHLIAQVPGTAVNLVDISRQSAIQLVPNLSDSFSSNLTLPSSLESPVLTRLVDSGALPTIAERLPDTPLIYRSPEASTYSSVLHAAFESANDWNTFQNYLTADGLVNFDSNISKYVPALAQDWTWSENRNQIILYLREGVKWSDGVPFTSEDINFSFNESCAAASRPSKTMKIAAELGNLLSRSEAEQVECHWCLPARK